MDEKIYPAGTWVTVHMNTVTPTDRSWCGSALMVMAYDAPYYVVRESTFNRGLQQPFTLDSRRYELSQLSDEYVQAMCGDNVLTSPPEKE